MKTARCSRTRWSLLTSFLLALVATTAVGEWRAVVARGNFGDFGIWWGAVKAVEGSQIRDIYSPDAVEIVPKASPGSGLSGPILSGADPLVGVISTPFHLAVLGILQSDDLRTDFSVFQAVNIFCLILTVLLFAWFYSFDLDIALAFLLFLLLSFSPHLAGVGNANLTHILVAVSTGGLLLGAGKHWATRAAGMALLGLAVLAKPVLILLPFTLIFFLGLHRGRREAVLSGIGFLGGALVSLFVGAWFFRNPQIWSSWGERIQRLGVTPPSLDLENFGLPVLFQATFGSTLPDFVPFLLGTFLLIPALRITWISANEMRSISNGTGEKVMAMRFVQVGAATISAYPLWGPLSWGHYYLLSLPLAATLLSPPWWKEEAGWKRGLVLLFILLVALDPLRVFFDFPLLLAGWLSWCGLTGLFLVGTTKPFPVQRDAK